MIHLLLPAYNEEEAIGKLIESVINLKKSSGLSLSVLVVDDGSTDNTAKTLDNFKKDISIEVISHEKNKGLGEALKSGILFLLTKLGDDDIVVTMDSDNTHDPSLIPLMANEINKGYDAVIGSRFLEGGKEIGVPNLRKFLSRCAKIIFSLLFHTQNISDYTSGYRAFKAAAIKKAFDKYKTNLIEESGFTATVELLLKLRSIGARMSEVPLVLRYDFKKGKSKLKIVRTVFRYLYIIVKFSLSEKPENP